LDGCPDSLPWWLFFKISKLLIPVKIEISLCYQNFQVEHF
jgi:hypothetical protein